MKKRNLLLIAGAMTALLLTGCQSGSNSSETEALKQQIAQLEQQVASLEQQTENGGTAEAASDSAAPETGTEPAADNGAQVQTDTTTGSDSVQTTTVTTTNTMEELTSMVDAFVEKVDAARPGGTDSENLEQFFNLKQEENQIDHSLDLHEDELEDAYRKGTLTRDEYKSLERELEKLEDKLDLAEDKLEITFGIDD